MTGQVDDQELRYAVTYWMHGAEYFDYGPDLEDLVRQAMYAEERGEQARGKAYEAVNGEWVEVSTDEIRERFKRQSDADFDTYLAECEAKPFRVWVFGPGGISSLFARRSTVDEANAVAASLPAMLRPVVIRGDKRPRAD